MLQWKVRYITETLGTYLALKALPPLFFHPVGSFWEGNIGTSFSGKEMQLFVIDLEQILGRPFYLPMLVSSTVRSLEGIAAVHSWSSAYSLRFGFPSGSFYEFSEESAVKNIVAALYQAHGTSFLFLKSML